ncbi:MAG: TrmB family transcriptional regulator [bacterium]
MDDILSHLKELGFNSYEAKVYVALLKHNPATGYEVSKESGVPQARAYDTLKSLETRQVVVATGAKPATYVPIPHDELLTRCERAFNSSVSFLRDNLSNLSENVVQPILNLNGEKNIYKKAIEMIEHAQSEIFLELWHEDLPYLEKPLKEAYDRGVDIKVVGYNDVTLDFGLVYQHGLGRTIENSLGGRWVVITVDDKEGITGVISSIKGAPQAVWTKNPGIVLVMKEVIIHDMFLLDVEQTLGDELTKAYGKDLLSLREKVLGKDFAFSID